MDGKPAGERPRDGKPVSLDEITVGARYYTLGGGRSRCRGSAGGTWPRCWSTAAPCRPTRRRRCATYLDAKYAALRQQLPPDADGPAAPLVPVKDPPPVQVLLPGFTVRELPLDLTNVNNVLYRPDGTLVALGYNGVIWHLRDTDGDGLEDKAEVFWDSKGALRSPIGMDLTPPGYKHGDGVFVVAKTRCVLIVDTDKDGKADKEIVVAERVEGELPPGGRAGRRVRQARRQRLLRPRDVQLRRPAAEGQGREAAVQADRRGRGDHPRVAGLQDAARSSPPASGSRSGCGSTGTATCSAPTRRARPGCRTATRSTSCSTSRRAAHYGFPPRHPKHLPDVIDEPSTFDYGPQHQSTCGFCFNEPVKDGGPTFGPKAWAGDAIVTGESRGKLYRTQLVKTAAGYVARTQLLACLSHAHDRLLRRPGRVAGGRVPQRRAGLGQRADRQGEALQDHLHRHGPPAAGARLARTARARCASSSTGPVDPQLLRDVLRQTKLTAGPARPGRRPVRVDLARLRGRAGAEGGAAVRRPGAVGAADARPPHAGAGDRPAPGRGPLRADPPRHGPPRGGQAAEGRAAAGAGDRPRLRPDRVRGDVDPGRRRAGVVGLAAAPRPRGGPGADRRQRPARRPLGGDGEARRADAADQARPDGHAPPGRPARLAARPRVPAGGR